MKLRSILFICGINLLGSFSWAKMVNCDLSINNQSTQSLTLSLQSSEGEPEGSGAGLLHSEGRLKIFVLNYPVQVIANVEEAPGVVGKVYRNSKSQDLVEIVRFTGRQTHFKERIEGNLYDIRCSAE